MSDPWPLKEPALKLCDVIRKGADSQLGLELLKIDSQTSVIIFDMDGIDYVLSMRVVPRQRPRQPVKANNDNA